MHARPSVTRRGHLGISPSGTVAASAKGMSSQALLGSMPAKRMLVVPALLVALVLPEAALASEAGYSRDVTAPRQAFELTLGTAYTEGNGRIASAPGRAVADTASGGVAFELGAAFRISPRFSLGAIAQYSEYGPGAREPSAARGLLAGLDGTLHFDPYRAAHPFFRVGVGYRILWERHDNAPDIATDGLELGRVAFGIDFRMLQDLFVAPFVGADVNVFLWDHNGPGRTNITSPQPNTFVVIGAMGRFDLGGRRETAPPELAFR
jgi:hypothetical protein